MNDPQQWRAYAAEDDMEYADVEEELSLQEVKDLVKKVLASKWWRKRSKVRRIRIKDGRGNQMACTTFGEPGGVIMTFPRTDRYKHMVMHEVAHVLQTDEEGHGEDWAGCYIALVEQFISKAAAKSLRKQFCTFKVRWRKHERK